MGGLDAIDAFLHGSGLVADILSAGRGGQGGGQQERGGGNDDFLTEHEMSLSG